MGFMVEGWGYVCDMLVVVLVVVQKGMGLYV
jgi:hypothetical protein